MTIVCATRFTEESAFAVNVAAELAKKRNKTLWLVHVLPNGVLPAIGGLFDAAAAAALEKEARRLMDRGLDVQVELLHGRLDQALGRFCAGRQVELVVVGDTSQKVSPVMGGTLDALARGVETPLLVVRDPGPFDAWAAGKAPLKVMLAIDHTSSSAVARDWIARLAEFGDLDLVATHIWWPSEEYARRKLPPPGPEEGHGPLAAMMSDETMAGLRGLPRNVNYRVHLEIGLPRIGEQLLELANEEQVDVFVVGSHRRRALGRLGSVSHHILSLAPMSVACIPATVPVPNLTAIPSFYTAVAATNLTEAGNRAIACALGVVGQGTVHVVHVAKEPFSGEQEAALLRKLAAVLPPDAEQNGTRVLVHVRHGDVATEILKAGQKFGADVVCLGMRSGSASSKRVVDDVLRQALQPVLFAPAVPD